MVCGARLSHLISTFLLSVIVVSLAVSLTTSTEGAARYEPWQILRVPAGEPQAFDEWIEHLADQDVIYLGEEHHNRWHVEAALKILRTLLERGHRLMIGMEMFGWDGQASLDRYVTGMDGSKEQLTSESGWNENWGGAIEDYLPLPAFARVEHLQLLALNPPRSLVRTVARRGLAAALGDAAMARWGIVGDEFPDDPRYREVIMGQLQRCHGGLSETAYERMYEASLFRDEGMAATIARAVRPVGTTGSRPFLSYTGSGHIQYGLPVPRRVSRRIPGVKQTIVYLLAWEPGMDDDVQQLLDERIADFIWLTPVSSHGPARRCR